MFARRPTQVVPELVFSLVSEGGKGGDGRGELVVSECFVTRHCLRRQAERELQSKAESGCARLGQMQFAGVEDEGAEPSWTEGVSVADHGVEIVVMRGQSGRGQSRLLHQVVVREVTVL